MIAVLKIVHFLCLLAGGAAVIGNGLLLRNIAGSARPPDPVVARTMKQLRMTGLAAIVLLWLTGIGMVLLRGGMADGLFAAKLFAAAVALWAAAMAARRAARAARAGRPPDPGTMRRYLLTSATGSAAAIVLAVLIFG